jgi:Gpi18-like mannosyltransferase
MVKKVEKLRDDIVFSNTPKNFLLIFIPASIMLFAKLIFSYIVYGTNDITTWIEFADIIHKFGTFKIYSLVPLYNHPPLMSWILELIRLIVIRSQLSFPFVFRLMPILADYGSIFLIWGLLKKYKIKNINLICLICIFNPINFLISGFHGNTDPVFVFFVLLATYLLENNKIAFSALIYGLSMCIKVVPIMLAPFFFFYLRNKKDKITFISFALIPPVVVFLPYLIHDYHSLIKNIFLYSGMKGIWGLGLILWSIFKNENINIYIKIISHFLYRAHIYCTPYIFLIYIVFLSKSLMRNRKLNLVEATFLVFCLFFAITPGFGVQYLSWISLYAIIVSPILGTIFVLLGGFFLYRVYVYWGGSVPPYYANSLPLKVTRWHGFENALDIILWLIIITMLIKFLLTKNIYSVLKLNKFNK